MKIIIVLNNSDVCYLEYQHTGILPAPKRRAVELELTQDQIDQLGIKEIGSSCGNPIMETIESISLKLKT